ncbi:MAG TPA: hypothetical protein VGX03_06675 [Candidatus Binatia bacterium]|jgi:hypothetical protein|nr:hypothetical protein [Candidatus Binatia bacterium]
MTAQEATECLERWLQVHCPGKVEIVCLFPRTSGSWIAVLESGEVCWQQLVSPTGEVSGPVVAEERRGPPC